MLHQKYHDNNVTTVLHILQHNNTAYTTCIAVNSMTMLHTASMLTKQH